jgi:RecA/RadA recombinase
MPRMPVTEISKKMAALEAKLNKKPETKGGRVMADIDHSPNTYFLRRPSGIMSLDVHTGGGLPAGGLTYLSGPDGAGKTFLLYKYFAMNQRLYGPKSCIALGATEAAPDHFFMRKCGMQIAIPEEMIDERVQELKIRGLPPYTKEQLKDFRSATMGHVKVVLGGTGEEVLDGLLDCFQSKAFDIIGLDSVSACLPAADKQKDLDENAKRAAAAGLLTKFFQHYLNGTTGYYGNNPTTVIFTSQVRANPDKNKPGPAAMWAREYAAVGAWAAKHGKLIDILVMPGKKDKETLATGTMSDDEIEKERKRRIQVGKTIRYEVTKGKAGIHEGITGEFEFHFPIGASMNDPSHRLTDDQRETLVVAFQNGILEEKDGFLTLHGVDGKPIPSLTKIAGYERFADMMRADLALEMMVRRLVLSSVGIVCAYP